MRIERCRPIFMGDKYMVVNIVFRIVWMMRFDPFYFAVTNGCYL